MMHRGGQSIILFILFFLTSATLFALPPHKGGPQGSYLSGFISMDDGLPSNFVEDLFMDSSGFLWVGTSGGGLCRYDGYAFLSFSTNTDVSVRSNFVRNLAEDCCHRLWIGSEGGLDVLDLSTYAMVDFSGTALEPYLDRFCSYLTADADGCIWACFDTILVRISFDEDGSIASVDTLEDYRLSRQTVVFKDVEGDGSIWLGLEGRVRKVIPAAGGLRMTLALEDFEYREDAYLSDFLVKEDEVWISTADGLYRYGVNGGRWRLYGYDPADSRSLSQNFITGLALAPDKRLIATSLKGFNVFDPLDDSFIRFAADRNPDMLSSDFINCIKVYGDEIWLGTESAGIVHLHPGLLSVDNYVHDPSDPGSIAPNPVNAIYEDSEGRVWLGNVEGGISLYEPGASGFRHLTAANSGIGHNSVSALCEDSRGRLWVGTWGGGVDVISKEYPYRQELRPVPYGSGDERLDYVGSLAMDTRNDLMWITSNVGIYYYDLSSGELHSALPEQPNGCIGSCIDASGRLWLGSQEGVFVIDLRERDLVSADYSFPVQNFKYKLDNPSSKAIEKIYSICLASDGTVWLGSYGNGFYRVDEGENGRFTFTNYSSEDGLVNDGVKCILEDASGTLWISTENGLSQFWPETGRFASYTARDGLASSQFYWNAAMRSLSGELYFGHVGGLSVVDPDHITPDPHLSHLHFTRISVGERPDLPVAPAVLRLHERDRSIGFEFSALTYGSVPSVRYSSFLEGQDDGWTDLPAGRNFIDYSSLRKGKYTLHIKATDDLDDQEYICSLPIRVKPYFYHTGLFLLLMAMLVAGLVFLWQDMRMRSLIRQREALQTTVEARTRELNQQKRLLEEKAEALARQNRILLRQNEELAGHKILFQQENRPSETRDEAFVTKALDTIREMYKDPDLDVNAFSSAMGMSKTLLNNRLQDTIGQSIGQFIRTYRLSIAREIIMNNRETHSMNISEIAYEVGFNDPKYFTRCFTKEFGMSPSSYPNG